jgi:hypothetical protein
LGKDSVSDTTRETGGVKGKRKQIDRKKVIKETQNGRKRKVRKVQAASHIPLTKEVTKSQRNAEMG